MKFALLALVLLVAACFPVRSHDSKDEDIKDLVKKIGTTVAHGVAHKIKGFFGAIAELVKGKSGSFTIDGTPLVLKFHAHSCKIKIIGKRMLLGKHVKCEAVVTEEITGVTKTCTEKKQMAAVECASKLVLEAIKENLLLGKLNVKNLIKHHL